MTSAADDRIPARFRHSVLAAQRAGHRWLGDRLRPLGLTPSSAEVLAVLADHGPLCIHQLGDHLICEADHPSRLVSRLVAAGLVSRRRSPTDGRAVELSLTSEGTRRARAAADVEAELDRALLDQAGPAALDATSDLLGSLIAGDRLAGPLQRRFGHDRGSPPHRRQAI